MQATAAALLDDFNTPLTISNLSAPLKAMNDLMHTKAGKKQAGRLATLVQYKQALQQALQLLGLAVEDVDDTLLQLRQLALKRADLTEEDVAKAIQERVDARAAKNYARSDEVRADLAAKGVMIMDTPQGTSWRPGLPQEA